MIGRYNWQILLLTVFFLIVSCTSHKSSRSDLVNDSFPEAQDEIRKAVDSIVRDLKTANIESLKDAHLVSDKFTKFGPRNFERQDVTSTLESEVAFFTSISDLKMEVKDLKIDVFGDVGITTYYPHFSYVQDGEEKKGSSRQTLVFLNTEKGWKIVHEHGTPKK